MVIFKRVDVVSVARLLNKDVRDAIKEKNAKIVSRGTSLKIVYVCPVAI